MKSTVPILWRSLDQTEFVMPLAGFVQWVLCKLCLFCWVGVTCACVVVQPFLCFSVNRVSVPHL